MILKQERPEMNDFERKQYFGCKRSFLGFYTTGFHLRDNV